MFFLIRQRLRMTCNLKQVKKENKSLKLKFIQILFKIIKIVVKTHKQHTKWQAE